MGNKINSLDLTEDGKTEIWNWPKFPMNLRLSLYNGKSFHRYNKAHAALYALATYDTLRALQKVKLAAEQIEIRGHWWHRLLRRVTGA